VEKTFCNTEVDKLGASNHRNVFVSHLCRRQKAVCTISLASKDAELSALSLAEASSSDQTHSFWPLGGNGLTMKAFSGPFDASWLWGLAFFQGQASGQNMHAA